MSLPAPGSALPSVIQEIVDIIGHGPAMELVRAFGGQELRIPKTDAKDTWAALVEIIGEPMTKKICGAFGGEPIYIALCERALRRDRNRRMIAQYEDLLALGHSARGAVSVLVREFRPISNRQVEKIVNSPLPDLSTPVRQSSLF